MNININIRPSNGNPHGKCVLCGEHFNINSAVAELDYWYQGPESLSGICPDCLAAGPVGAAKRTRKRAKQLRSWAHSLEQLADDMGITPESHWKTTADLRKEENHQEELMRLSR
jgi:hypothetical protein